MQTLSSSTILRNIPVPQVRLDGSIDLEGMKLSQGDYIQFREIDIKQIREKTLCLIEMKPGRKYLRYVVMVKNIPGEYKGKFFFICNDFCEVDLIESTDIICIMKITKLERSL